MLSERTGKDTTHQGPRVDHCQLPPYSVEELASQLFDKRAIYLLAVLYLTSALSRLQILCWLAPIFAGVAPLNTPPRR